MKLKVMLSTITIMGTITTGAFITSAQASDTVRLSTKQETSIGIKDAHLTEKNVLRMVLTQPHKTTDKDLLYSSYDSNKLIGNAVEKNGKIIGFDIDLKQFAKSFPTKKDKEEVVKTLHLKHYLINANGTEIEKIEINNNFIKEALMNAMDPDAPQIKDAYLQHYNVLRIELNKAYTTNNSELSLTYGAGGNLGTQVKKDGKIIAFDIDLDGFANNHPTEEDRENLLNSLYLMETSFTSGKESTKLKIENEFITSTLMNAVNQGELLPGGSIAMVTNISKLEGYKKFVTQDAYADQTLGGKITTETLSIGLRYNTDYRDDYTFILTNNDGAEVGVVIAVPVSDDMFIQPDSGKFLNQEYTVSAISVQTGEKTNLFKFTPFNLF